MCEQCRRKPGPSPNLFLTLTLTLTRSPTSGCAPPCAPRARRRVRRVRRGRQARSPSAWRPYRSAGRPCLLASRRPCLRLSRSMTWCWTCPRGSKGSMEQGMEQGMEQCMEQGMEQGIVQGTEQGRVPTRAGWCSCATLAATRRGASRRGITSGGTAPCPRPTPCPRPRPHPCLCPHHAPRDTGTGLHILTTRRARTAYTY